MNHPNFPRKILALHILGLGGLLALPAQAMIITNSLTATVSAKAGTNPAQTDNQTNSAYVSRFVSDSQGSSYTSASAWGNQYGVYRAAADGSGKFDSKGRFQRSLTIENDNGFATAYGLSFYIYGGNISANSNGVTGTGFASYDLSIKRGTNALFASYAKIDSAGALTRTGTNLDFASQFGTSYSWGGTYVNLDLGVLGMGDSLTIDFDLVSTAFGDFGFSTTSEQCYGGYGGQLQTLAFNGDGYGGCTGSVYASLGDPSDFQENGINDRITFVTQRRADVPLPGTLALLAIGLGGLGVLRRRLRS